MTVAQKEKCARVSHPHLGRYSREPGFSNDFDIGGEERVIINNPHKHSDANAVITCAVACPKKQFFSGVVNSVKLLDSSRLGQPPPQPQIHWNWAAPTAQPLVPSTHAITVPTLPPPEIPRADPKLLAHNTARMIREIASFSDVHHGANDDYGAVQKLMEAFFVAMTDPKTPPTAQDAASAADLFKPQYDGTELGANRPLTNKLFESDMVLTVEQMKAVVLASTAQRRRRFRRLKRKVITGAVYRWPKAPIHIASKKVMVLFECRTNWWIPDDLDWLRLRRCGSR
ncbi:Astacin (Peptidase M12A) [Parelaphostrongylus tenuis]|uniref:Astacin (Peptidase M12A) n=1 Tax=Parelaphostrongylus tenuis TaxID=148309 RepID=A0AAD5QMY3_PARTN|nr:Astacin (Peptidase M12A) [Parelaphostrongylus tenuis]